MKNGSQQFKVIVVLSVLLLATVFGIGKYHAQAVGSPDLIRDTTWSGRVNPPTSATAGSAVTIKFWVKNAGGELSSSSSFAVKGYFNSSVVYSNDYRFATDISMTSTWPMGGGQGFEFVHTIPSATSAGTYYYYFWIDAFNSFVESNETNNQFSYTITVTGGGSGTVDYDNSSLTVSPSTVTAGDNVTLSYRVYNRGTSTSPSTPIYIYRNKYTASYSIDSRIDYYTIPSLASGLNSYNAVSYSTSSLTPGTYVFSTFVDPNNSYPSEVLEGNNKREVTITVNAPIPNLVNSSLSASPSNPAVGTSVTVSSRISNPTSVDTPNVLVKYYLNGGSPSYSNAAQVYEKTVDIYKNDYEDISFSLSLSGLTWGTYILSSWADPNYNITETSDADNKREYTVNIAEPPAPVKPNLTISSLSLSPNPSAVGTELTIASTVSNITATASPSASVMYYIHKDTPSNADVDRVKATSVTLGGNGSQNISFTVPGIYSEGNYVLRAWVDLANSIPEERDDDNYRDYSFMINAVPKTVDLFPYGASVNKTTFEQGETITMNMTLQAIGSENAGTFYIYYYLKQGTSADYSSAYKKSEDFIYYLASGSSVVKSGTIVIPTDAVLGSYKVYAFVDAPIDALHPNGAVLENNETNNKLEFDITVVVVKPNLQVQSISFSPNPATAPTTINVEYVIANVTSGNPGGFYVDSFFTSGTSPVYSGTPVDSSFISVGPNATKKVSFTIPLISTRGMYTLSVWADSRGTVLETIDSDNKSYSSVAVRQADLFLSGASLNKTSFTAGESIAFDATLRNIGDDSANGFVVYFYLKPGTTADYNSVYKKGEESIYSLGSGITTHSLKAIPIPSDAAPGPYKVYVFADAFRDLLHPNGNVIESIETNNTWELDITVTAPKPDFLPLGYVILNPTATYEGDGQMTVRGLITNPGATGTGVNYSLKLKSTLTGDSYSLLNPAPATLSIASNSNNIYDLRGTIPSDCLFPLVGIYDVIVTIDPNNSISEINDSNNTTTTSNTAVVSRGHYCDSVGGEGDPMYDLDEDFFLDIEERYAGTREGSIDIHPIYDINYTSYSAILSDKRFQNYGADPVNTRTGAFEFSQTDFSLPGRGVSINYVRTYNSKLPERNNRLGYGWNSSYNIYYYKDPSTQNVQVYLGGTEVALFITSDGGVTYTAPLGEDHTFVKVGESWEYRTLDGIKYTFSNSVSDNLGVIEEIVDRNNNKTTFYYTTVKGVPLMQRIQDPSGRSMRFIYGASDSELWDKIVQVDENVSDTSVWVKRIAYEYGSGNLTKVIEFYEKRGVPKSREHIFTYDANHHLLTYKDPRLTILRNEYDASGRVTNQYEIKPGGSERLIFQLSYSAGIVAAPGSTACATTKNFRNSTTSYQIT